MEFVYKVRDGQGRVTESVAQAESASILRTRLTARGMDVLEIRSRKGLSMGSLDETWESFLESTSTVTLKDMVIFSRQFAAMISSGVAMLRTLYIIVEQCPNRKLRRALDEVRVAVESGLNLSDALEKQSGVFDSLYVSMVRAGEAGGILAAVLQRLADYLEYKEKLNQNLEPSPLNLEDKYWYTDIY